MSRDSGVPAFPQFRDRQGEWPSEHGLGGLTKREVFAAMAMHGILANAGWESVWARQEKWHRVSAQQAVAHADALLDALGEAP